MTGSPDKTYRKVAVDMTWVQMKWALTGIGIALVVYAAIRVVGGEFDMGGDLARLLVRLTGWWKDEDLLGRQGFDAFVVHPSKIFMLVLGITSVSSFMTFFVKQGATRTAYFYGAALSSVFVAFGIALITGTIESIEQAIWPSLREDGTWISHVLLHALHMLVYFAAGWVVGAGFYRFGSGGMLYILLAVCLGLGFEVLWLAGMGGAISGVWPPAGSVALVGAALAVVRLTTRRVRVRVT